MRSASILGFITYEYGSRAKTGNTPAVATGRVSDSVEPRGWRAPRLRHDARCAHPPTLAVVALGFFIITLVACYLAARRVTSIDPDRLLRDGG